MNRKPKRGTWQPKVHIVFRAYAVIFGLLGIMLLLWGPVWYGGSAQVRAFGSLFLAAAGCAALLSRVKDAQMRRRSLFWFAMGHAVLWLAAIRELGWDSASRLDHRSE